MTTVVSQQGLYDHISQKLPFIRPIYRSLFSRRRTYAAFETTQLQTILTSLSPTGPVFDPMSGYGVLEDVCRSMGISTFSIELNPPSYLWQLLMSHDNKESLLLAVEALKQASLGIQEQIDFEVSESWFPPESIRILINLWEKAFHRLERALGQTMAEDMLAAVLLPFVGRLSSHSPGTINIHVKRGGVVHYKKWKDDLQGYLYLLTAMIFPGYQSSDSQHVIVFGDASTVKVGKQRFSYMVTSPPYPNMKDYYAFFFPENYALERIFCVGRFTSSYIRNKIIGTAVVSEFKKTSANNYEVLLSGSAKKFLYELREWKGGKKAVEDNKSYYLPYFLSYFTELEKSYRNVECCLADKADAYIVVVNNTARKYVIPVHAFVKEVWQALGFSALEDETLTNERSHVGSINPRAVGFKARHMEYAIRINRGKL